MKTFQMIREIGRGGYGRAILSECLDDDTIQVLNEIDVGETSRSHKDAISREIRVLRSMHHSNIVSCDSHHFYNGTLYIAMEYADDADLRSYIKSCKDEKFWEETVLDWFVQMCLTVKYIHD
jgi:NIMA (never in mitosis gene a)-related kinase